MTKLKFEAPVRDRTVVPARRRYLLRLRTARPAAISVEGTGELSPMGGDAGSPGWWMDGAGFLCLRLPDAVVVSS